MEYGITSERLKQIRKTLAEYIPSNSERTRPYVIVDRQELIELLDIAEDHFHTKFVKIKDA